MSLNYEYMLQRAVTLSSLAHPRILDFGCGQGQLVKLGLDRGMDIFGVDAFSDDYHSWRHQAVEIGEDRIQSIVGGRIPFDNDAFDVVVANQVFEHIESPLPVLIEIARVLRPGGSFLALFPDSSVWFEGHAGLYFVHWMSPRAQRLYLTACHRLGFGYYRGTDGAVKWARAFQASLGHHIFYHSRDQIEQWWAQAFGQKPKSIARDWMIFRISASPRHRSLLSIVSSKHLSAG